MDPEGWSHRTTKGHVREISIVADCGEAGVLVVALRVEMLMFWKVSGRQGTEKETLY